MALFSLGKKKENEKTCCTPVKPEQTCACGTQSGAASCCCDGECGITSIKVLGSGCKNCHDLYENCCKAVNELGMKLEVEYITDMEKVMTYGIMSMPGVVVNEKIASMGKVLKPEEVVKLLKSLGYC